MEKKALGWETPPNQKGPAVGANVAAKDPQGLGRGGPGRAPGRMPRALVSCRVEQGLSWGGGRGRGGEAHACVAQFGGGGPCWLQAAVG